MIITVRQPSELQRGGICLALWAASVVVSFDCPVLPGGDGDDDGSDCGDYNDTDPDHKKEIDHNILLSPSIVQFCLLGMTIAMLMTMPIY